MKSVSYYDQANEGTLVLDQRGDGRIAVEVWVPGAKAVIAIEEDQLTRLISQITTPAQDTILNRLLTQRRSIETKIDSLKAIATDFKIPTYDWEFAGPLGRSLNDAIANIDTRILQHILTTHKEQTHDAR